MPDSQTLIARLYAAFNCRDIDAALALMSEQVDWPKASEGGRVVGKQAIRDYWTRQWAEFDPHVDPLEISTRDHGDTAVKVHQLVKDLSGSVLFEGEIWHVFRLTDGLVQRMDIAGDAPWPASHPS